LRLRVTAILFGSGLEPMPSMTSSFKIKRNRFALDTTYFGIGFGGTVRMYATIALRSSGLMFL
jgi:hypothetical protein